MVYLSIEHIMPQTGTPYWYDKAALTGEDYIELVNTLGNLILVSKKDNSAAKNKNYEIKKGIFEDTLHIKMNKDLYSLSEWTANSIGERGIEMAEMLIVMYPYLRSTGIYNYNIERNIFLSSQGIKAEGYLNENETVTIYPGSQIYWGEKVKPLKRFSELRQELLDSGIVEETLDGLQFVQEYTASSVSNAAALILGGSRNGWDYWKDADGVSINEFLREKKK